MVLFLDASALAKAYVAEAGSEQVRLWIAGGGCAVSRLSEIEVSSALARRAREGHISAGQARTMRQELSADLAALTVIEVSQVVAAMTHRLLSRHPLRAGDAIQLASVLLLAQRLAGPVQFACADARLRQAGVVEGLAVVGLD